MKKKIALLLLAALTALALVSCGGKSDETPIGFKKASNDDACAYTMYVPENWTVSTGSVTDYTMATFTGGSVSMAMVTSVAATTVDEYWQDCQEEYARIFEEFTPDAADKQGAQVKLDESFGTRYFFNAKYNGVEYRYMQIYTVHQDSLLSGSSLYIFTFTARADLFDSFYDNEQNLDVLAILSNFKFD